MSTAPEAEMQTLMPLVADQHSDARVSHRLHLLPVHRLGQRVSKSTCLLLSKARGLQLDAARDWRPGVDLSKQFCEYGKVGGGDAIYHIAIAVQKAHDGTLMAG
jgi:hypothetical protein